MWRRRVLGLVAIARICPDDVRLTLEQAIPGGMRLEDYSLLREVIAAIRGGLPEADQLQPVCAGRPARRSLSGEADIQPGLHSA